MLPNVRFRVTTFGEFRELSQRHQTQQKGKTKILILPKLYTDTFQNTTFCDEVLFLYWMAILVVCFFTSER